MKPKYCLLLFFTLSFACTHTINVKNEKKGKLIATHCLVPGELKKIPIDYETAPQSPYMQMIDDNAGTRLLTCCNPHTHSIDFYDYETGIKIGSTRYEKEGPNGVVNISGYYIQNMDSIFIYNTRMQELVLTDNTGKVKKRISFRGDGRDDWYNYFPQYLFFTVIPIIKIQDKLILTGCQTIGLPAKTIDQHPFAACLDLKTDTINYIYTYPKELYGNEANWEGYWAGFVYPELSPDGEMIHSFPMSHHLYTGPWDSNDFTTVYAGSNKASTMHSIAMDPIRTPGEVVLDRLAREDIYTAIRYDRYRQLYYRIILHGIPGADRSTPRSKKPVSVIIMDRRFNYMGETEIGTGEQWNWNNMFVTREGLNIEYISDDALDEDFMIFQIFKVEKSDDNL